MTEERIKEILGKQLELLAEKSEDGSAFSESNLPDYTRSMLAIAAFLRENEA